MAAIRATGNTLKVAMDVNDSVGILDSHFPEAEFFTEFERFAAYVEGENGAGRNIHFISIASPNYLHDAHMRFALRAGCEAICEKPLVLCSRDIDELRAIEEATGRTVNTILQLRLHPAILELRDRVAAQDSSKKFDVDLTYVTARGNWYLKSWKGAEEKSGGIATNIGVHFYDMLHFVFGGLEQNVVHLKTPTKAAGYLEYARARVRWFLSLDVDDVPAAERAAGRRTFRAIRADGVDVEFSDGFTDLHTRSYEEILAGRGFGLEVNRVAIETVETIRTATPVTRGEMHPFTAKALA